LERNSNKLANTIKDLERETKKQKEKLASQKSTIEKYKWDLNEQKDLLRQNKSGYEDTKDEVEKLIEENDQLRSDNAFLAEQHIELRKEHEELIASSSSLHQKYGELNNAYANIKDEELLLRNEIRNMDITLKRSGSEAEDLRQWIVSLEEKNKELGDTIRTHFYTQATDYQEKVMTILKHSEDPNRSRKLEEYGIQPSSWGLNNIIKNEHISYASRIPDYCSNYVPPSTKGIREQYHGRASSSLNSSKITGNQISQHKPDSYPVKEEENPYDDSINKTDTYAKPWIKDSLCE